MQTKSAEGRSFAQWVLLFAAILWIGPAAICIADDRPNIVVILTDDLGYSDIGPYGGEMATPNLDDLATGGLRFRSFYVAPRCSNTRSSLLTGMQSHSVGLPNLANNNTKLPKNHVMLPEVLRDSGYRTYMSGKWHLGETSNFGTINGFPRDPRVRGFDHFWGFTEGHSQDTFDGSYRLLSDSIPERSYSPGAGNQPGEFYQTDATTDYALDFLNHNRTQDAATGEDKPLFMYVAYGAPHFPLQARDEWVDPLVSRYTAGWDALREDRLAGLKSVGMVDAGLQLPPRSDVPPNGTFNPGGVHQIPAWNSLGADRQADLARRMAIYAAMVERVDYNIGRIIDDLDAQGELDNTIIMFLSDNGADAEWHEFGKSGFESPRTGAALDSMGTTTSSIDNDIFYGTGWANVSAAPFRNYKHFTHEGGIISPAIVHWGAGLDPSLVGAITDEVGDVRDVMPTLLELVGAELPQQYTDLSGQTYSVRGMQGTSLAGLFTNDTAVGDRDLGWAHEGNRAFRRGDWKVVSSNFNGTDGIAANEWELYNVADDPTETNNLADDPQFISKRAELIEAWNLWAWHTGVSAQMPWSAGDLNKDQVLDGLDVAAFLGGWREEVPFGDSMTFARGDIDLDGDTDLEDWVLLRTAFHLLGRGAALAGVMLDGNVPEPATCWLLAPLLLLRSRCRR